MTPQLDPKLKDAYQRVVVAGMKVLYSPQTRQMLITGLRGDGPVAEKVASQIAGVMKTLDMQAGMKIPKQILAPAAITLMMDLFKLLDAAKIKYAPEDVSTASGLLVKLLVQEYTLMQQTTQPGGPQAAAPQPQGMIGA